MRILWLATTPSLYDERNGGGWVASLEHLAREMWTDITLGIAFEYPTDEFRVEKTGVTYYPINKIHGLKDKFVRTYIKGSYDWGMIREKCIRVVEDFKPDLIHVFGTEWPWGLISKDVKIPVVIHIQGIYNVHYISESLVESKYDKIVSSIRHPKSLIYYLLCENRLRMIRAKMERDLISANRFFMGRTHWDKMMVNLFAPQSHYFYCSEAIRPDIYTRRATWHYNDYGKARLLTISQAGVLKGNEIILRTAYLLKYHFGFDFEWKVAGNPKCLVRAEKRCGIKHEDVNIELIGLIPAKRVAEELGKANMFIHPSIIDNSPNALCEAQLIGCPVIASNVGGVSSLIEDKKTGLLYPYNEPHVLAGTIMQLYADVNLMNKLSIEEVKIASQRHSPDSITKDILKIYEEVIAINSVSSE